MAETYTPAKTCGQGHNLAKVGRYKDGGCKACRRKYMRNYMRAVRAAQKESK